MYVRVTRGRFRPESYDTIVRLVRDQLIPALLCWLPPPSGHHL